MSWTTAVTYGSSLTAELSAWSMLRLSQFLSPRSHGTSMYTTMNRLAAASEPNRPLST